MFIMVEGVAVVEVVDMVAAGEVLQTEATAAILLVMEETAKQTAE
jgi:hypothetical protein